MIFVTFLASTIGRSWQFRDLWVYNRIPKFPVYNNKIAFDIDAWSNIYRRPIVDEGLVPEKHICTYILRVT